MFDFSAFWASLPPAFTPAAPFFGFWLVWGALGAAALGDALTGRVSRALIYAGGLAAIFSSQQAEGWSIAGERLAVAWAVFLFLRLVNEGYYRLVRRDPFGYGDMRFSALAAYAFGLAPVFWAWIFGAWVGLAFLALGKLAAFLFGKEQPRGYIHFAPFLLLGLLVALYGRPFAGLLLALIS